MHNHRDNALSRASMPKFTQGLHVTSLPIENGQKQSYNKKQLSL